MLQVIVAAVFMLGAEGDSLSDMRVYVETPQAVQDARALTAKHTNTVFTMPEFASREVWEASAAKLRKRILLSSGLWPLPEKTPLHAQVTDELDQGDYTVSKVVFQAYPWFLVTGNLYKPKGEGPFPGVVSPHGHWEHGRLEDGERGSVPARAITLAKLGMVTFTYDMIGYTDSLQFPHNWGGEREKLYGVHPFAMQLWSAIRAVDFLESLPYVDKDRIGATGASGGGTQTFVLTAVDPRIKVSAPVNMISSTMQGGCLCENAPILRLNNSNMEIGAMMAPKPLLLVSATGDWTRETPRVEYPAIRSIYALYGATDRVKNVHIDAGHNYNQSSREAMYRFFAKHLLGLDGHEDYVEPPYEIAPEEALRVFADKESVADGPDMATLVEEAIVRIRNNNQWQLDALLTAGEAGREKLSEEYREALQLVLDAGLPEANALAPQRIAREAREDYVVERWVLGRKGQGDAIPALFYTSMDAGPQDAVLLVHGEGKSAFGDAEAGGPGSLVLGLIAQGKAVLAIDTFLTGEHHGPAGKTERYREGNFMDTFQPTDTGYRIQDVLTALGWLHSRRDLTDRINVLGLGDGGLWAMFAAALDTRSAGSVVLDLNQFPVEDDAAWVERFYIPCIRGIGDVETALTLLSLDARKQVQVFNAPNLRQPDGVDAIDGPMGPAAILDALS